MGFVNVGEVFSAAVGIESSNSFEGGSCMNQGEIFFLFFYIMLCDFLFVITIFEILRWVLCMVEDSMTYFYLVLIFLRSGEQ